jgi:hypothetical protein
MCRNNESGRYVLSSFCGYFSKPCSGCCPKDKQSCVDGTTDTVLARATYTKGVKNIGAVCSPMDLCRGSQNRCQPRRRITLDRSPLELRFLPLSGLQLTTSDLRTLAAHIAPSATSSFASSLLPPPAPSLNLGAPTLPGVHTPPPPTSFMNKTISGSTLSSWQVNRHDTHPEPQRLGDERCGWVVVVASRRWARA